MAAKTVDGGCVVSVVDFGVDGMAVMEDKVQEKAGIENQETARKCRRLIRWLTKATLFSIILGTVIVSKLSFINITQALKKDVTNLNSSVVNDSEIAITSNEREAAFFMVLIILVVPYLLMFSVSLWIGLRSDASWPTRRAALLVSELKSVEGLAAFD